MGTIIRTYQTRGEKYRKELIKNNDNTFLIVDYTNNEKKANDFLGVVEETEAIKTIEKSVLYAKIYDDKTFNLIG